MKLRSNAWHVKLNKFVYGDYVRLNENLCPYFWKTLAALPLSLLALFGVMSKALIRLYESKAGVTGRRAFQNRDWKNFNRYNDDSNLVIAVNSAGVILLSALLLLCVGTILFFTCSLLFSSATGAMMVLGGIALVGIIAAAIATRDLWMGMVSAVYHGLCPSVTWVEESEEESEEE